MSSTTTFYTFYLPDAGDGILNGKVWAAQVNQNFTDIDTLIHSKADSFNSVLTGTTSIQLVDKLQFNTALGGVPAWIAGLVFWDPQQQALSYHTSASGVTNQIGQELHIPVTNKTGSTITNGSAVYVSGALGGQTLISLAKADSAATSDTTIGVATDDILNNGKGMITTFGIVHDLNTNAWAEGTQLYLSETTAGALTSTKPSYPNRPLRVATVTRQHITQGELMVHVGEPVPDHQDLPNRDAYGTHPTPSIYGTTTVWNDINASMVPMRGGGSEPAIIAFNGDSRLDCYALNGTTAVVDEIHRSLEILHDYKEGSDIHFHIHWYPTTAAVGNVKLQVRYAWFNRGNVPGSATTVSLVQTTPGVAWQEQTASWTISGAGKTMGSRFVFNIFRDAADPQDTYAADIAITDAGVHYEVDAIGSRQILVK